MPLLNTSFAYGLVSRVFHWTIAILIFILLMVGFYMTALEPSPQKFQIYALHKSLGILVLMLAVARITWRLSMPQPQSLATHKDWEKKLASFTHFCLYAAMIAMPVTGILMSWAGGFPVGFFGLDLESLIAKNAGLFVFTLNAHVVVAYLILAALALHMTGALKHHFIDKDTTLERMAGLKLGFRGGVVLALIAGALWGKAALLSVQPGAGDRAVETAQEDVLQPETALPGAWIIDLAQSSLDFEVQQYSHPFTGGFKNFGGDIVFDPGHLDQAHVAIWIDIASLETGSTDRDEEAKATDWFDVSNHPKATFTADSFTEAGPNQYTAHGILTVRGVAKPVDLPFTLEIRENKTALMKAELNLRRLDFGIGQGEWQAADAISDVVKVTITVTAHRR